MPKTESIGKDARFASSTLIVVGSDVLEQARSVEYYHAEWNQWATLTELDVDRVNFECAILDSKLIITGGRIDGYPLKTVQSYDFSTRQLTTLAPMKVARVFQGVAVFSGELFVIGGYDKEYFNSVEKYNPSSNQWSDLPSMPTTRAYAGVTLHRADNEIYVIGGFNGEYLTTVEAFNPSQGTWRQCASMNQKRDSLAVVSIDNYIYAVGGYDSDTGMIGEVDRYEPATNSWSYVNNMSDPRHYCIGINFNDVMIVAGGADNNGITSLVESYQNNYWSSMASLVTPRVFFSMVEVPMELIKKTLISKK